MKNNYLKKLIVCILFVLLITNSFNSIIYCTSSIEWGDIQNQELSKENQSKTFVDLNASPDYEACGDLLVVGDSFAYLFASHCGKKVSHVVHQGYNIERINNELMDMIPNLKFKHSFLFIGPNDYMEQTDIFYFQRQLQEVFNKAHDRNMKVIVTNYFDPDYNDENAKALVFCTTPCFTYELIIKDTAERNGFIFMDINDLLLQYGHHKGDFVHPNRAINKPILTRLLSYIDSDNKNNENKLDENKLDDNEISRKNVIFRKIVN